MAYRQLHALAWALLALLGLSCQHGRSAPLRFGPQKSVELVDTLPELLRALEAPPGGDTDASRPALRRYLATHRPRLAAAGALDEDPGELKLGKLVASADALRSVLDAFDEAAPAQLNALAEDLFVRFGATPRVRVVFAVSLGERAIYRGQHEGWPLVLVNARKAELSQPDARAALLARELFLAYHREAQPDSASLSPVALQLFREGAAALAARQLLPRASEAAVVGVEPERLKTLKVREALCAKELLASLESADPSQLARFFDPQVKDPLLPPGAGRYLADRVYQRLVAQAGSSTKPLHLSPAEFAPAARKALLELAER